MREKIKRLDSIDNYDLMEKVHIYEETREVDEHDRTCVEDRSFEISAKRKKAMINLLHAQHIKDKESQQWSTVDHLSKNESTAEQTDSEQLPFGIIRVKAATKSTMHEINLNDEVQCYTDSSAYAAGMAVLLNFGLRIGKSVEVPIIIMYVRLIPLAP
jgi:hypothetical protein